MLGKGESLAVNHTRTLLCLAAPAHVPMPQCLPHWAGLRGLPAARPALLQVRHGGVQPPAAQLRCVRRPPARHAGTGGPAGTGCGCRRTACPPRPALQWQAEQCLWVTALFLPSSLCMTWPNWRCTSHSPSRTPRCAGRGPAAPVRAAQHRTLPGHAAAQGAGGLATGSARRRRRRPVSPAGVCMRCRPCLCDGFALSSPLKSPCQQLHCA